MPIIIFLFYFIPCCCCCCCCSSVCSLLALEVVRRNGHFKKQSKWFSEIILSPDRQIRMYHHAFGALAVCGVRQPASRASSACSHWCNYYDRQIVISSIYSIDLIHFLLAIAIAIIVCWTWSRSQKASRHEKFHHIFLVMLWYSVGRIYGDFGFVCFFSPDDVFRVK